MKTIRIILGLLILPLILIACGPSAPPDSIAPVATANDVPEVVDSDSSINDGVETESDGEAAVQPIGDTDTADAGSYPAGTEGRRMTAMGNPDAPVIMIEYSDYQCPFCRRYFQQTMPQIKAEFIDTGRVYYVFKDFPIASLHPLAYRLHEAALCAGDTVDVDAYWRAHDLFFTNAEAFQQNTEANMDAAILSEYERAGLPTGDIEGCLQDGRYADEVQSYVQEGQLLGVRGTPNFFINGTQLVGAQPYAAFKQAIEQAERGQPAAAAPSDPPPPSADPGAAPTPISIEPREMTAMGNPNAPVTIVEYSDYQCPFCRRHVVETMPQLKENFIDTGRVYYVFKDFPIASLHPLAYRLHEAALCVADVADADAFWQAHDLFFEKVETFQVNSLTEIDAAILAEFENVGLPDVGECLASGEFADAVQSGVSEGQVAGVTGTPAFFINGYPVSGAQPYDLFEFAIGLAEEGTLADAYRPQPNDGKAQATAAAQPGAVVDVPIGDAPSKGALDAPVTIVEYSDYQCPFCLRHFSNTMPQLQQYIDNGSVRYVFKDFPLHSIHPQAEKAHEAARCARELGGDDAYWAMHDLLFVSQESWGKAPMPSHVDVLKALASEEGLPQAEFDECLDSGRYYDAVTAEVAEGSRFGVSGTPAFFINGRFLSGAQPFPAFQEIIEQMLANK